MRLHFDWNTFGCKKLMKFLIFIIVYSLLVRYMYSSGYSYDLFPKVNVRELLVRINEEFQCLYFINLCTKTMAFSILANFIVPIISTMDVKINTTTSIKFNFVKYNFDRLEESNPFLYSYKTRALLE